MIHVSQRDGGGGGEGEAAGRATKSELGFP